MSFEVHGTAWLAGTLRAWHLAVLRYAVTLDNADRLAVLRIAREIDRLYPRQQDSTEFEFFRRTSAELCAAILQPNERFPTVCNNIWPGLTMIVSNEPLRRRSTPASRPPPRSAGPPDGAMTYGRGFPPAAIIEPMSHQECCMWPYRGLAFSRATRAQDCAFPEISARDRAYSAPRDGIA
jgi:hypothetical protein